MLGFLESAKTRTAADKRVTPESAALDRLEQERRAALFAQPEVRPHGGDQVGRDLVCRVHGTKKTSSGGLSSGAGCRPWSVQAQAAAPLEAPRPGPRTERK